MFKKLFVCMFLMIYSLAFAYSDQVVVSQFDISLKESGGYKLSGVNNTGPIRAVKIIDDELDKIPNLDYTGIDTFTSTGSGNFSYGSKLGKAVIFPVSRNEEKNIKPGVFELSETTIRLDNDEPVTNFLIRENFNLPVRMGDLWEVPTEEQNTGKKFKYSEFNESDSEKFAQLRANHIKNYKIQQYMIRIVRDREVNTEENTRFDIIGQKNKTPDNSMADQINSNNFVNGTGAYIDFWVDSDTYDKEQKRISSNTVGDKVELRFLPGNIEVYGLPKGNYRIEIYSFRYSMDTMSRGTLVVTKERVLNFDVDKNRKEKFVEVTSFSTRDFEKIKATVITATSAKTPVLSVDESYNGGAYSGVSFNAPQLMESVYIDGALIPLVDGKEATGNLYYNLWTIEYTTAHKILDDQVRQVRFRINDENIQALVQYQVSVNVAKITGFPHQTIFAVFKNNPSWKEPFEIDDKNMSKYSQGYRGLRTADTNLLDLYSGRSLYSSILKENDSYNWIRDTGAISGNSVAINKVISDSKGVLKHASTGKDLTYYTTNWTPALTYIEKVTVDAGTVTDKATFTWNSPDVSSFTTVTQDKMIFRIVKKSAGLTETIDGSPLPKHYFRPFTNKDSLRSAPADLNSFIYGSSPYVDLVFDAGIGATRESEDKSASFLYSTNNSLQITGLPRGDYLIQIYSLQGEDTISQSDDSSTYRVLTYGDYKEFKMGLPSVVTSDELASQNNFFIINSKNFTDGLENGNPVRKLNVEFITKSQQRLNLTKSNIISRKNEVAATGGTPEKAKERIENAGVIRESDVNNLNLVEGRGEFQFPLDIVFLLDNSGSMSQYIIDVRNNINAFTTDLRARNFQVNYNVITFGSPQNNTKLPGISYTATDFIGGTAYTAILKNGANVWYDSTNASHITSLQTAFTNIASKVGGGYPNGPENAFHAMHHGLGYLNTNGRYLDFNNNIYTGSDGKTKGYIPSQKMLILLTDENASTNRLDILNNGYVAGTIVSTMSKRLKDEGVMLSGIYRTSVRVPNTATFDKYKDTGLIISPNSFSSATGEVKLRDKLGRNGNIPKDRLEDSRGKYVSEFFLNNLENLFNAYSIDHDIGDSLRDIVNNVGIVQSWNLSYNSPFPESDGLEREVIFSLTDIKRTGTNEILNIKPIIKEKDRFYRVPEQRLEAHFENPNLTTRRLVRKYNPSLLKQTIELSAIAQSQFRGQDGKMYNYPITKGTFIVTAYKSDNGVTKSGTDLVRKEVNNNTIGLERVNLSDYKDINNNVWYRATANLDAEAFMSSFGKNPIDLKVEFIAETATDSKNIYVDGLSLVEGDAPKVTQLKMTNTTLKNFMAGLKTADNGALFTDTTDSDGNVTGPISSATIREKKNPDGLGILEVGSSLSGGVTTEGMGLNVKDGDKVTLEFTIDDESISSTNGVTKGIVQIIYNGVTYNASYVSGTGSISKWKVENIPFSQNYTGIRFNIIDDSPLKNQSILNKASESFKELIVYNIPPLLDNTSFKKNTDPNADPSGDYYKDPLEATKDKTEEILAYLFAFDYDKSKVDKKLDGTDNSKTYASSGSVKWASSLDGKFSLGDGIYKYNGTVYIMNKAGAIKEITTTDINTLDTIIPKIGTGTRQFYVDTIAPRAEDFSYNKIKDKNFAGTTHKDIEANKVFLGINKPFKAGDTIRFTGNVEESNLMKVELKHSGTSYDIFVNTTLGSISSGVYLKEGEVRDINGESVFAEFINNLNIEIYDKAGNKTTEGKNGETLVIPIHYDDRKPDKVATIADYIGDGIKYAGAANKDLAITSDGLVPVVFVETANGYVGPSSNIRALTNGTSNYPVQENANNIFRLKSYSHSGMAGDSFVDDSIVLDTEINSSSSYYKEISVATVSGKYQVELNKLFSTIGELVGLSEFKVSSAQATEILISATTGGANGGYKLIGSPYSKLISSYSYTNDNKMQFKVVNKGEIRFTVTVYDRLNNFKDYDYRVQIPNNINIIGATSNSNKKVESKIGVTDRVKISSRKE